MGVEAYISESERDIDLQDLKQDLDDLMTLSEKAHLLLTLADAKPATDVEGFFPSQKQFETTVEKLNSAGFNCYVIRDPESTMTENWIEAFDSEELDKAETVVEDSEVTANIFVTPENYQKSFFKPILDKRFTPEFHRRYGEFLGFSDRKIEAFVYCNMPGWRRFLYRLVKGRPPEVISDTEAIEKYKPDMTKQQKKIFSAFTFGKLVDKREEFEMELEKARRRKQKAEDSDIDLEFFLENLAAFSLIKSEN